MTRRWALATIGFSLGLLAGGSEALPELFRRLTWAWDASPGEYIAWGEPFFDFLLSGLPGGLLGLVVGLLIAAMWCGPTIDHQQHVSDHRG